MAGKHAEIGTLPAQSMNTASKKQSFEEPTDHNIHMKREVRHGGR
jgi:hypothetical protein